jgi:hypothetical protein
MKRIRLFLTVSIIMALAGCQQSEQKQNSGISRRDRLVANENMNLKNELARCRSEKEEQGKLLEQCQQKPDLENELAQCRSEIEKQEKQLEQYLRELDLKDEPARCRRKIEQQKELLEQCRQEKAEIEQQNGETVGWLMNDLPKDLLKEVERLTKENEQLRNEVIRLGGQLPEAEKTEQEAEKTEQ